MHCTADGGKLCLLSKTRVGASLFSGSLLIDEQSRGVMKVIYVIGKPAAALTTGGEEQCMQRCGRSFVLLPKLSRHFHFGAISLTPRHIFTPRSLKMKMVASYRSEQNTS